MILRPGFRLQILVVFGIFSYSTGTKLILKKDTKLISNVDTESIKRAPTPAEISGNRYERLAPVRGRRNSTKYMNKSPTYSVSHELASSSSDHNHNKNPHPITKPSHHHNEIQTVSSSSYPSSPHYQNEHLEMVYQLASEAVHASEASKIISNQLAAAHAHGGHRGDNSEHSSNTAEGHGHQSIPLYRQSYPGIFQKGHDNKVIKYIPTKSVHRPGHGHGGGSSVLSHGLALAHGQQHGIVHYNPNPISALHY